MANNWITKPLPGVAMSTYTRLVPVGKSIYAVGGDELGGGTGVRSYLWRFDLDTEMWIQLTGQPVGTYGGATVHIGGKIFVASGLGAGTVAVDRLDVYDIATDTWTYLGNVPYAGLGQVQGAVVGGKLYMVKASVLYEYNPVGGVWTSYATLRNWHTPGIASYEGKLHVVGAYDGVASVDQHDVWDPATSAWANLGPDGMAKPTAVGGGGYIFRIGGTGPATAFEIYSTAGGWLAKASALAANNPANLDSLAVANGRLFFATGEQGVNTFQEWIPDVTLTTDLDDESIGEGDDEDYLREEIVSPPKYKALRLPHVIKPDMSDETLRIAIQQNNDHLIGWSRQFTRES